MMSEPRPSSPQSKTDPRLAVLAAGTSRVGSDGSSLTSSHTTQTRLARGLRNFQPDRSLPLTRGFQPSSSPKRRGVGLSSGASDARPGTPRPTHPIPAHPNVHTLIS